MKTNFAIIAMIIMGCTTENSPKQDTLLTTALNNYASYYKSNGDLEITNLNDSTFNFTLNGTNGANLGTIEGIAEFTSEETASFEVNDCKIIFNFLKDSIVEVIQAKGLCEAGMGVTYSGRYFSRKPGFNIPSLEQKGVLKNKAIEDKLRLLISADYEEFVSNFEQVTEEVNFDSIEADVYSGMVPGLGSINEAILMVGNDEKIWAAMLKDEEIKYYSTETKTEVPKTIKNWINKFPDKEMITD